MHTQGVMVWETILQLSVFYPCNCFLFNCLFISLFLSCLHLFCSSSSFFLSLFSHLFIFSFSSFLLPLSFVPLCCVLEILHSNDTECVCVWLHQTTSPCLLASSVQLQSWNCGNPFLWIIYILSDCSIPSVAGRSWPMTLGLALFYFQVEQFSFRAFYYIWQGTLCL